MELRTPRRPAAVASLCALLVACSSEPATGPTDAGPPDAGPQVPAPDGGDAGALDGGASPSDGGEPRADAGTHCGPFALTVPSTPRSAVELIVTTDRLAGAFEELATLHTLLGTPTEVVTVTELCASAACSSDPSNDVARAIKAAVSGRSGLKYVLLGAGQTDVPGRAVEDHYEDPLPGHTFSYSASYPSDYYYADFSAWDTNHDGVYAQPGVDTPDLLPEISVGRLPAREPAAVATYAARLERHLTDYPQADVKQVLLVSNVGAETSVAGVNVQIDSARWFLAPGRTLSLLRPDWQTTRLWANPSLDPQSSAYTVANAEAALVAGANIVVHAGHANNSVLMAEPDNTKLFDIATVQRLTNTTYPFFFSTGCEAADTRVPYGVGEVLVTKSSGGALAYLGNVPVGLGLAGGVQLIDEALRHIKLHADPMLGDALLAAHRDLPDDDTFPLPIVNLPVRVVTPESWAWTQKAATLLGDPAVPVWTSTRPRAPTATVSVEQECAGFSLKVQLSAPFTGTARVQVGADRYELNLVARDSFVVRRVARPTGQVIVGLQSANTLFGYSRHMLTP